MQKFFITSPGTDIGKTLVMTALCWQLRQQGKQVTALKPVISGFDAKDPGNDSALILKSCGLTPSEQLMKAISPWQFSAPIAPGMAAARENRKIEISDLVKFCRDHEEVESDILLAEGAGGVMSPIGSAYTMLDLMTALRWPVILVGGSYLGALSHTLSAVEVLRSRGIPLRALVVSESEKSPVSLADTVASLEIFMPTDAPVVKIPRLQAKQELWKQVPLISWICAHDD